MQKIETLFLRDPATKHKRVMDERNPDVDMSRMKDARATRKWDGSACLYKDGVLYHRHAHKESKGAAPAGWIHWTYDPEKKSGHGWLPIGDGPSDQWHREAFAKDPECFIEGMTYELVGPKLQKNPEKRESHELLAHGGKIEADVPLDFKGLKAFLENYPGEGLVWWDNDGPIAKIKKKDFVW